MAASYRRDDAVLLIAQDNTARRVDIVAANDHAQSLLGYSNATLEGKPLQMLLPDRLADLVADYVEYDPRGNDVANVLGRARDFQLLGLDGGALPLQPKFVPTQSDDSGRMLFQMMLHPMELPTTAGAALRVAMRIPAQPDDPDILPRQHMLQQIESWQDVPAAARLNGCVALLVPDQLGEVLEWHGEKGAAKLLHEVMLKLRQKLRSYDTAIALPRSVAMILLDATPESAHMVLNRLRWELATQPIQLAGVGTLSITLSATYGALDTNRPGELQLSTLEQSITDAHRHGRYNQIVGQASHMPELV